MNKFLWLITLLIICYLGFKVFYLACMVGCAMILALFFKNWIFKLLPLIAIAYCIFTQSWIFILCAAILGIIITIEYVRMFKNLL